MGKGKNRGKGRIKAIALDYFEVVVIPLFPSVLPFVIIGAAWRNTDFLSFTSIVDLVGTAQLYLISLGLCGALWVRLVAIERLTDRRMASNLLVVIMMSAGFGLGLTMTDSSDPRGVIAGFGGFLLISAVGFVAPYVCILDTKRMQRSPVIDLREDREEIINRMVDVCARHPDIAEEFDRQRQARTS
jgi:hypothetical protein